MNKYCLKWTVYTKIVIMGLLIHIQQIYIELTEIQITVRNK